MGKRGMRAPVATEVRASWHWLIVRDTASEIEVLTLEVGGGQETLPVFGSKKAAMKMLPPSGGWRVRKTGGGELISILYGPCSDVTLVAVNPSPELVEARMVELVSEKRSGFLDMLLGRGRAWFYDSLPGRASRSSDLWSLGAR